jgi:hypothetical protein
MAFAGSAQAAPQGRDLSGDAVVDAFYDIDLDITWLGDANVNGPMGWDTAANWADNLSLGTYRWGAADRRRLMRWLLQLCQQ